MTGTRWLGVLAAVAVAVGLGYSGIRLYRGSESEQCYACRRAIHSHARTIAVEGGHARAFCCPACALTEREQSGKPVRVTELTDFLTGARLSPDRAFILKGSDVNMCAHTHEIFDSDKQVADVQYDRCSPSLLAFGNREDAAGFAREHGGQVVQFREIVSAFSR